MSSGRIARLALRARKQKLFNAPRPVAKRPLNLPADLQPAFVNGRWRKPRVSARYRAALRKEAMVNGTFGSYSPETGGWDPSWDRVNKSMVMKAPKGRRHDNTQHERIAKIQANLAQQEQKIADYKESLGDRRKEKGVLAFLRGKPAWHAYK